MAEQQWAEAILLFHRQCAKTLALCVIGCSAGGAPFFVFLLGQFTRNYTQTTKWGLLTTNEG